MPNEQGGEYVQEADQAGVPPKTFEDPSKTETDTSISTREPQRPASDSFSMSSWQPNATPNEKDEKDAGLSSSMMGPSSQSLDSMAEGFVPTDDEDEAWARQAARERVSDRKLSIEVDLDYTGTADGEDDVVMEFAMHLKECYGDKVRVFLHGEVIA